MNKIESRFPRQPLPELRDLLDPCNRAPVFSKADKGRRLHSTGNIDLSGAAHVPRLRGLILCPAGNPCGRSGLRSPSRGRRIASGSSKWIMAALFSLFLASCAGPPPAPRQSQPAVSPDDSGQEVQKKVREPARQESKGVQVFPLQNPAVKSLMEQAREAESQGNFDAAVVSLERAMRIQPRDPEILQAMAEVQLHKRDYEQALNFAVRSYDSGSRVGELCARNWHTIAVSRERLGDNRGADEAKARAGTCMNTKPRSY